MDRILFTDIKLNIDSEDINSFSKRSKLDLSEYIPQVLKIAKPKAILKKVSVRVLSDTETEVDGHVFTSRIMADKLKDQNEVYLYAVTAGSEITNTEKIASDNIKNLLAGAVLVSAIKEVYQEVNILLGTEDIATLNPGSLPDWNIDNNKALCELIGDVFEIGIKLTDKGYMQPWNSSSGIIFKSKASYQNCMLCKNYDCIGRRAKFDEEEYKRIFG